MLAPLRGKHADREAAWPSPWACFSWNSTMKRVESRGHACPAKPVQAWHGDHRTSFPLVFATCRLERDSRTSACVWWLVAEGVASCRCATRRRARTGCSGSGDASPRADWFIGPLPVSVGDPGPVVYTQRVDSFWPIEGWQTVGWALPTVAHRRSSTIPHFFCSPVSPTTSRQPPGRNAAWCSNAGEQRWAVPTLRRFGLRVPR
jgi:hypothetical protein